jgi:hypothetical protein
MDNLKLKPEVLINNRVMNIIHKFSIQSKIKIAGSNKYRGILYSSDVDIESKLSGRAEALREHFKKVFQDKTLMKKVFFMDFKCGIDDRLVYDEDQMDLNTYLKNPLIPKSNRKGILKATGQEREDLIRDLFILRWTPQDIIKGKIKLIDNTYKSFVDCLNDDTRIKLDLVIPAGSGFVEMSEVYTYKQTPPTKQELIKDLEQDIKYYKSFNTLKATKRLFSLLKLENKNKCLQKKLIYLFNSEVGFINKIKNDLTLMIDVDDKHGIDYKEIEYACQIYKERLGRVAYINEKKILLLNTITKQNYRKHIIELLDYLLLILNKTTKSFLEELDI